MAEKKTTASAMNDNSEKETVEKKKTTRKKTESTEKKDTKDTKKSKAKEEVKEKNKKTVKANTENEKIEEKQNSTKTEKKAKTTSKKKKAEKENSSLQEPENKKTNVKKTEKAEEKKTKKEEKKETELEKTIDVSQIMDEDKKEEVKKDTKKENNIQDEIFIPSVIDKKQEDKTTEEKRNKDSKIVSNIKSSFASETAFLIILTCMISLIIGSSLGMKFGPKEENHSLVEDPALKEFIKDYNYLIDNYYGEVNKKELLNTAFKSMVDILGDDYSGSLDESTSNNFDIELQGSYSGLGIEIINDEDKNIFIYSIIPDSPASKTDLQKGDKIVSVNGKEVSGMTTTEFINKFVKASKSDDFTFIIERAGTQKTIQIKKEYITLKSVTSKTYEENGKIIGYLKVSVFASNTYEQFKRELENLEYMNINSLIIDLRDNSGGHLTAVRDMISLFLDSSHVIYQTQSKIKTEKTYSSGKETKTYPIVILANSMSASASEVMIGALTEEYGATLIGNQTFGKGTVQELHSLSNGDEYKFTTKKWLTPKGNWVNDNGIKPTIEVTLSKGYYDNPTEQNDNQLQEALNYLRK